MTIAIPKLKKRADNIENFCALMVRMAREHGLSFQDGVIACKSLGAAMAALNNGGIDSVQIETMMREVIDQEVMKYAIPLAGKAAMN